MKQLFSSRTLRGWILLLSLLPGLQLLPVSVPGRTPIDARMSEKDLGGLLDPIFAEQMEKVHIPGAVVVVVKDGRIAFTKGYGYAKLETRSPVVAEKTIFRIGSITKVFTATAVMQLADRGTINLGDDVSKYLKSVTVPPNYARPITFANLLTHTSGLDEISPGRRTGDQSKVIPLDAFLKTRLVRYLPPGKVIVYSTYNAALAGLLVESIAQTHFKTYLDQNVFETLGMSHTSIGAVKNKFKDDLAGGYEYDGKNYQRLPFQWFHTYPASDINSTATDMARFMIAQLQGGAIEGRRILSARATREMQSTHFRNHPRVPGWAYGFYEGEQNGLRFVEHGGSMDDGYSALLTLFPSRGVGLFVACNTEQGGFALGEAVKKAVLDRYFPTNVRPEAGSGTLTKGSLEAVKRFAGKYRPVIYCHSCPANSDAYQPELSEVVTNADGTLLFHEEQWRQIEPPLFKATSGPRAGTALLGFRENSEGKIIFMFQESYRVYERVLR
jgi:CubicO group peptidase (beta-lactamase class C family)